jgi:hypothetical protein
MKIRYRCPTIEGGPLPGHIIMGDGPRVRRAYRVLGAKPSRGGRPALGCITWNISVEPMSAASGRAEIAGGCLRWGIVWDKRGKRA